MRMKKKQQRARGTHNREKPGSPDRTHLPPRPSKFHKPKREQNDGKDLVLKNFQIVCDGVPRRLGTEWPNFRVAVDQNENPRRQETCRPRISHGRPALFQSLFGQEEQSGTDNKETGKV